MSVRKKILFIAGWRTDFGDFVAEHARAAGLHHDVFYLHVEFVKEFRLFPLYRIRETLVDNDPRQVRLTISCFLRRFGMFKHLVNKAMGRALGQWGTAFDLVHVNVRTPETEVLVFNKRLAKVPKVLTEHSTFYHTKINTQFPDPAARRREKERVTRWLEAADFTQVMPVSRDLGQVLVGEYGIGAERIRVVPNVAAPAFLEARGQHHPHPGTARLLLVAFWSGTKNLQLFADALAKLAPETIDRLAIDLVGEGELVPGFLAFIKQRIPSLKITAHGFVGDANKLANMYRAADFLVHPTDAENLPCVIIESLCCGTPVLSNQVNGIGELVQPGVNGLLAPKGDADAFAHHLRQIASGAVQFNREAVRQTAVHRFSQATIGAQLSGIYQEALAANGTLAAERPFQQCSRCLLDTRDDRHIQFDEDGVCTYCHRYARLEPVRLFRDKDRRKELEAVVARIKSSRKHAKYDCVAGVSGGVDSSYVALKLKQLGLNPLLVHLDNGWNTQISERNIQGIVQHLGFDLHKVAPDGAEFKDIQLAFLRASVVDIELPTDHAVVAYIYNLAARLGIEYIISGDNFTTEGVNPKGWSHDKKDLRNIRSIVRRYSGRRLRSLPRLGYFRRQYLVLFKGIKVVPLLNYLDYDKAMAKQEITAAIGWTDYGFKHGESIFTRFYQEYILPVKFHVSKRKAHLSTLICSGQMSRQAALEALKQDHYPEDLRKADFNMVLQRLGLSHAEFDALMKAEVRPHSDFPTYAAREYLWEKALRDRLRPITRWIRERTGVRHESNYV
ncbi:MAG: N-acetyl sugar amidotransferase [Flavobacteriales bacterium]|nr:N-acetyl sugar amidotransferase [Flavobacteriales bacterium]